MCGISGIVNGSLYPNQSNRGPNDSGRLISGNVCFTHNRLSIIDLSDKGHQPMNNDRYMLTYNGEIYNYKEMRAYMNPNDDLGGPIQGGNDADTLLRFITKFGLISALDNSNGMFAFALYDKLEKNIYLAVDRFAQKPLYYTQIGETFAFASSPAALLHLKPKWKISQQALQTYWLLGSVMNGSIWEGIEKVNGSEIVKYNTETKKISKKSYWEPQYNPLNDKDLTDLILDSIRKVKVSDVPVYLFLSGGIDSTVVASECRSMNAIHLEGPEVPYAHAAAKTFNIDLKVISPHKIQAEEAIKSYSYSCGEPSMSGIIPWIVSRETSKYCKVAISANGADELFFGYDRTTEKITPSQLAHIFRTIPGFEIPQNYPQIDERLSWGRWMELKTYVESDLNKTLDYASMCHSLEVRCPFLDHRLVEAALSVKNCGRKDHLKAILKNYGFMDNFINRPKHGFSLYQKPLGYIDLQEDAFKWAINEKYLPSAKYSIRDLLYLKASAAGFKIWHECFKEII